MFHISVTMDCKQQFLAVVTFISLKCENKYKVVNELNKSLGKPVLSSFGHGFGE